MQNRYAGDVGDFGKLGVAPYRGKNGLPCGVLNWYRTFREDEHKINQDGKHTGYLNDNTYVPPV